MPLGAVEVPGRERDASGSRARSGALASAISTDGGAMAALRPSSPAQEAVVQRRIGHQPPQAVTSCSTANTSRSIPRSSPIMHSSVRAKLGPSPVRRFVFLPGNQPHDRVDQHADAVQVGVIGQRDAAFEEVPPPLRTWVLLCRSGQVDDTVAAGTARP